jgi:hypothetical protein
MVTITRTNDKQKNMKHKQKRWKGKRTEAGEATKANETLSLPTKAGQASL